MLSESPIHPTIPAKDLAESRRFYEETLGLQVTLETEFGIWFSSGGVDFFVFPSQGAGMATHTLAGFRVTDLAAVVADLKSKGVVFEDYDLPSLKTEGGIFTGGPGRAAWLKDPSGNILGIVELKAEYRSALSTD